MTESGVRRLDLDADDVHVPATPSPRKAKTMAKAPPTRGKQPPAKKSASPVAPSRVRPPKKGPKKGRHFRIRADIAEGGTLHVSHNMSDAGITVFLPPVDLQSSAD